MRYSILFGTLIALVIYIFCQWMIIGIVSTNDLQSAYQSGGPITQAVQILAKKTWVKSAINLFGISALITSLLGVSFSVIDFLEDGLKLKRKGKHRFVLCLLTLVPPFIITTYNPSIFLFASGLAGGFGEAFLNGILPAWLVWIGRYKQNLQSGFKLFGGKILLTIILIISVIVIGLEINILMQGH